MVTEEGRKECDDGGGDNGVSMTEMGWRGWWVDGCILVSLWALVVLGYSVCRIGEKMIGVRKPCAGVGKVWREKRGVIFLKIRIFSHA